ncbi:hypothetical protein PanWU01x14_000660 [Parasponia andersonii]|uniref:Uncharacterized protein n=1 Tax=Parasponia andersonii TaxID=3476 RepID=A0A2P5E4U7_PARAD|nr:hypothetical protein PanWU01x14_000660 [Parasponia andersonii]
MNPPQPEPDHPVPSSPSRLLLTVTPTSGSHRKIAIAVDLSDESAYAEKDGEGGDNDGVKGGGRTGAAAVGSGVVAKAVVQQVELHPVPEEEQEYLDASDEPKDF